MDPAGQLTTRRAIILRALRSGQSRRTAAKLAGVDQATFFTWLLKGEQQTSGRYREFREQVTEALTQSEARLVTSVYRSIEGGVFTVVQYDEHGRIALDANGKPKTKQVLMPPDGRLALKLLQIRNPATWGPGGRGNVDDLTELDARPPAQEAVPNIFKAALDLLNEMDALPAGIAPASTIEVEPGSAPIDVETESTPVLDGAIDVTSTNLSKSNVTPEPEPSTPRLPAVRMVPLAKRRRK